MAPHFNRCTQARYHSLEKTGLKLWYKGQALEKRDKILLLTVGHFLTNAYPKSAANPSFRGLFGKRSTSARGHCISTTGYPIEADAYTSALTKEK